MSRGTFLSILFGLASLLVPGIASAHSAAGAESRVWAFDLADQVHVAGRRALTPELHQGCEPANYDSASGSLLAARGGSRGADDLGTIFVDSKGNAIPTPKGGSNTGSPDGRFIQARDAAGRPTGVRIDGPHNPASHPDPRAQAPHGHVPGVTNPDGTPWLPIKQ